MHSAFIAPLPSAPTSRKLRCPVKCAAEAPLPPIRNGRISHAVVLEQVVEAVHSAGKGRLTVDFPPERTESRSGTLVARYENNLNFAERLLTAVTNSAPQLAVGGAVSIRDNINPQGGGEYLDDDEVITGVRAGDVAVVLNAGVDASTLRQLKDFDAPTLVLVNGALDRLSWFDKRSLRGAVDDFQPCYYCKVIAGAGVLVYAAPYRWTAYVPRVDGSFDIALQVEERPKMSDVESAVRRALEKQRAKR